MFAERHHGLFLIRGENVVLMGEIVCASFSSRSACPHPSNLVGPWQGGRCPSKAGRVPPARTLSSEGARHQEGTRWSKIAYLARDKRVLQGGRRGRWILGLRNARPFLLAGVTRSTRFWDLFPWFYNHFECRHWHCIIMRQISHRQSSYAESSWYQQETLRNKWQETMATTDMDSANKQTYWQCNAGQIEHATRMHSELNWGGTKIDVKSS